MQSTREKVNFASRGQHVFSRKNKKAIMKLLQDKEREIHDNIRF